MTTGIGVTPMVGILEYLAATASGRRTLVRHADRSAAAHPLRDTVTDLVGALRDSNPRTWYRAEGHGRMDLSELELPQHADYYLCGGNGFLQAVRSQLPAAAIPGDSVRFELFAPNDRLLSQSG
ncbi:hypothetical protein AB0L82_29055 [Nocardia sp. NPDC052001]|uniref:hypothetical protein n=1 Tax=Nocardia sp. NPDC052001 TaxID=3154853 RepID=UPI00342D76B6